MQHPTITDAHGSGGRRMFLGLRPPGALTRAWLQTARRAVGDPPGLRWLAPEDVHLTVRFLGAVDALQEARLNDALVAGLEGQATFDVDTRQAMWFPAASQPVVLAVLVLPGVTLAALASLVNAAVARVGLPPDPRPFRPHISLARAGGPRSRVLPAAPALPAVLFSACDLILFESLGNDTVPRYRPRRVFRFD